MLEAVPQASYDVAQRLLRENSAAEPVRPGLISTPDELRPAVRGMAQRRPPRIALVHDFLVQMGGAERVLEVLHAMYPDAPVYTSAYAANAMPAGYRDWDIRTSFLQRLPMKRILHRGALLLYPLAFESFDFSRYDLVISSSSAFAKGIITPAGVHHVCYTHTPMRYAWGSRAYLENERAGLPLRGLLAPGLHYLRMWDSSAASRVDTYVANSYTVAERIGKFYRRECEVVHPPVNTGRFQIASRVEDYYILASRFVPYKRLDLAVEAFTRLKRPLKVIGTGRQMKQLQARAGSNVEFLGWVPDSALPDLMARARAYVMPGEEDFGIAPVEANACGRPVIAYASGGALDTQVDGVTGVLFEEQTVDSLCEAVCRADDIDFHPEEIRDHAMRFDTEVFRMKMARIVSDSLCHSRAAALVTDGRIGQAAAR